VSVEEDLARLRLLRASTEAQADHFMQQRENLRGCLEVISRHALAALNHPTPHGMAAALEAIRALSIKALAG
jgi:hypothetical protein